MEGSTATTVTTDICSFHDAVESARQAFRGHPRGERISFESVEHLWRTLMSVRAAARLVGHDVKNVRGDVQALLDAGVLEKDEHGRISFPYDAIHADFTVRRAA